MRYPDLNEILERLEDYTVKPPKRDPKGFLLFLGIQVKMKKKFGVIPKDV